MKDWHVFLLAGCLMAIAGNEGVTVWFILIALWSVVVEDLGK